jgi:hypothetical protein
MDFQIKNKTENTSAPWLLLYNGLIGLAAVATQGTHGTV